MKVCVLQPPYSADTALSDRLFEYKLRLLAECDGSSDIIVLPEYSDVPCAVGSRESMLYYHDRYFPVLMDKCRETAKRCGALVFVNALCLYEGEYRNTTFAVDRNGDTVGKYFKTHIPPSERALGVGYKYTYEYSEPYVIEIEGVRYGFLTCYDFYFYEAFSAIARRNVDIIIGCSLQRSDSHYTTETICRFLAYNVNAYVLRSSVSFDESSDICGASMIVSPEGRVLANLGGKFGTAEAEIDPKAKFYKPAGFGRGMASHYAYTEEGRNPWQYRQAGPGICPGDDKCPYPRVCARVRFDNADNISPLSALAAAAVCGAEEISFDVRITENGVFVGNGGREIVCLEDVLKKLACRVIMNIRVRTWDENASAPGLDGIISLIRKYDCVRHVYFTTSNDEAVKKIRESAPELALCLGYDVSRPGTTVARAILAGVRKAEMPFGAAELEEAVAKGIICNVDFGDDVISALKYINGGTGSVITNNYNEFFACRRRLHDFQ